MTREQTHDIYYRCGQDSLNYKSLSTISCTLTVEGSGCCTSLEENMSQSYSSDLMAGTICAQKYLHRFGRLSSTKAD